MNGHGYQHTQKGPWGLMCCAFAVAFLVASLSLPVVALAENEELQAEIHAMQKAGVVVEACVACANNYGVADDLRALDIDVKPMGVPLSDRLKGPWEVLTF